MDSMLFLKIMANRYKHINYIKLIVKCVTQSIKLNEID